MSQYSTTVEEEVQIRLQAQLAQDPYYQGLLKKYAEARAASEWAEATITICNEELDNEHPQDS